MEIIYVGSKNSMNYELAKKLKSAGFPQKYRQTEPYMDFAYEDYGHSGQLVMMHTDNDTGWWLGQDYDLRAEGKEIELLVKCPTLSELIEACGDIFLSLDSPLVLGSKEQWRATACNSEKMFREGFGSTPEEAVANLWIALQANKGEM